MLTINNTIESFLENIEIKGNTVQDINDLSNIKSVGDKVGEQELYKIPILCCGKNLNSSKNERGGLVWGNGELYDTNDRYRSTDFIRVSPNMEIVANIEVNCGIFEYDKNKKFIKSKQGNYPIVTTSDTRYIKYVTSYDKNIQIQEGTEKTVYEPYQEYKITILSPTPLESLNHAKGKISDRIIERDGVWGIEKNIYHINPLTWDKIILNEFDTSNLIRIIDMDRVLKWYSWSHTQVSNNMFEELIVGTGWSSPENQGKLATVISDKNIDIVVSKDINTKAKALKYIEGLDIWGWALDPQFIPLPHAQQVKLKTFANKTNISFLTEIEGTIKADVAKSLGASVNNNTQEIGKINNRILDLEGLKESQEMAYETDKGYLVCKETKNGTIKDLKLYGKSLLNKIGKFNTLKWVNNSLGTVLYYGVKVSSFNLEIGKEYTIKVFGFGDNVRDDRIILTSVNESKLIQGSNYTFKFTLNTFNDVTDGFIHFYNKDGKTIVQSDYENAKILLLEGDHTQSLPTGYFEGIASVGDGVDKIEVSSRKEDGNLFDGHSYINGGLTTRDNTNLMLINKLFRSYIISNIEPNTEYTVRVKNCGNRFGIATGDNYSETKEFKVTNLKIYSSLDTTGQELELNITSGANDKYLFVYIANNGVFPSNIEIIVNKGDSAIFSEYIQDKKPLLFKDTDSTWKPIEELRGLNTVCDTVECGRYFNRVGKQAITENITLNTQYTNLDYIAVPKPADSTFYNNYNRLHEVITDTNFKQWSDPMLNWDTADLIGSFSTAPTQKDVWFGVEKGTTLEQAKQMLVGKNMVYQLAEEKVFEVNPLFLESYANETMISCESGAVKPGMEWKITSYITNLVSINTKRIKRIENDFYNYTVSQNRMMLSSRYNADRADFRIDNTLGVPKTVSVELDYDLFELMKKVVIVGKDNYDRSKIEEQMDFYVTEGFIDWEMWDELFAIIELQHNPPVDLTPIQPISIEEPKPRKK